MWRGTAHWDGCWCFWAVLEGSFGFGTALDLVEGCEMAVRLCTFVCDTARGVRFGQCRRAIWVVALLKNWWAALKWQCVCVLLPVTLPVVCDLGSAERAFYNLYCPQSEIRAV